MEVKEKIGGFESVLISLFIQMWIELKKGREPTSRRNALLAWVQET